MVFAGNRYPVGGLINSGLWFKCGRTPRFRALETRPAVVSPDFPPTPRCLFGGREQTYYSCFSEILREPFSLDRREYNPPTNETNALISFLNSMVYTACVSAIRKTALDPTVGFMHEPGDRRFTLSLDIADIYKPILADRVLFRLVNRQQISPDDFESDLDGCLLTEDGRLTVLEEYEETLDRTVEHPRLKRKVSYKTLVQTDVYSLKKHILTGEPYRPTERWW